MSPADMPKRRPQNLTPRSPNEPKSVHAKRDGQEIAFGDSPKTVLQAHMLLRAPKVENQDKHLIRFAWKETG